MRLRRRKRGVPDNPLIKGVGAAGGILSLTTKRDPPAEKNGLGFADLAEI